MARENITRSQELGNLTLRGFAEVIVELRNASTLADRVAILTRALVAVISLANSAGRIASDCDPNFGEYYRYMNEALVALEENLPDQTQSPLMSEPSPWAKQ